MAAIVLALASAAQAVSLPSGLDGLGVTIYRQTMQAGDYDMIAAAGLKVARTDLGWGYVETMKGVYDFSAFDAFYSGFHSRGITPLFILDYGNDLYGTDVSTETFRQGYAAYAAAAAAHFKALGGGVIWETSPEPDLTQYWSGSATDYMNMVKEAAPAIRQADSAATIIAPSTSTTSGAALTFLTTCFQQGLLNLVDAVDVHGYRPNGVGSPETIVNDYTTIRNRMKTYHSGSVLPLTCSEWGYAVAGNPPPPGSTVSEQDQADDLARVFLVNLSQGIPLSTWFKWEGGAPDPSSPTGVYYYGLVPDGSRTPLPDYHAAQLLTSSLKGETFSNKLSDGNSADWLLVFTGNGHTTLAAWTTGAAHSITDPTWGTLDLTSTPFYVDPTLLPGDANLDGRVDVLDLAILAANYRKHVTGGWLQGDFNNDGVVDVEDLALLAANYRHSLASDVVPDYDGLDAEAIQLLSQAGVTVVPEPGALVLLATGLIGLLRWAWRERKRQT